MGIEPRRWNRIRLARKVRLVRDYNQSVIPNLGYVLTDPEVDNFTYELLNENELVSWIASMLNLERSRVAELLVEARSNEQIYDSLHHATVRRWSMKTSPPIGRRLGWYVIVRLLRPERIIETGIHDGIGSLVLLAALDRNGSGELVSTDIDRSAGWIVGEHPRWSRRILTDPQDLEDILAETPFQIFLHDSLHTPEHERFELTAAAKRMGRSGVLISDNSHATDVLESVCSEVGRTYSFWHERPRGHFYPGGGIGIGV